MKHLPTVFGLWATLFLTGCAVTETAAPLDTRDVECMARAMYFESNRSSRDGMVAVGSVVMNRVASQDFPDNVCAVVSQRGQFAPGLMTRRMQGQSLRLASDTAASVLRGERHPRIARARFFHALYYRAGYRNMHYVASAGGNAFYEKRPPHLVTQPTPLANVEGLTAP